LLLILLLGIAVSSSLANTCISLDETLSDKFGKEFKNADAVFIGKVERFDFIKGVPNEFLEKRREIIPGLTWKTKATVFSVDRNWKGIDDAEISIVSDETRNSDGTQSSSDSDYPFEEGKTYLVFAWKFKGYLKSSECSFTRRDDQIDEILPLLGEGKIPVKPNP
jgi:hypothetical protein